MRLAGLVIFLFSNFAFAHEGHEHAIKSGLEKEQEQLQAEQSVLHQADADYQKTIKPIFIGKCLPCHSSSVDIPWYASLPLAKTVINRDRTEAISHLDMANDFPFGGHGNIDDDLQAIQKTTNSDSMPPTRYKLLHWFSGLTRKEKSLILDWISDTRQKLQSVHINHELEIKK